MIIRDNNIQKWLFDYFEGNLTPHEEIELNNFISQNPSYQSEFDAWQKSYPSKETKSKKNRAPVYAGASSLLVETSIWARMNWKHAAVIVTLITGASLIGYFNLPETTVSDDLSNISENNISIAPKNVDNELSETELPQFNSEEDKSTSDQGNDTDEAVNNTGYINNSTNNSSTNSSTNSESQVNIDEKENNSQENINIKAENNADNDANLTRNNKKSKISEGTKTVRNSNNSTVETMNHKLSSDSKDVKIEARPAIIFNNQVDRSVRLDNYVDNKDKKNKKRYFYTGFKDLAGRGIGVRNNKSKKDKELEQGKNDPNEDFLVGEYDGESKNHGDGEINHKRRPHNHNEIALMNLYDPIFVTSNSHPLTVNSALAGELGVPRIKSSFRLQNTNSKDMLMSSATSYDMYIDELKAGVGLVVSNNRLNGGMYSDNSVEVIYAQKFEISRDASFTAAVKYKGIQNRVNMSKVNFNAQMEVEKGIVHTTFSDVNSSVSTKNYKNDMGVATWYNGRYLYGGFELDNLLHSKTHVYNESELGNRLPTRFSAQIGTDYRKSLYSDIVISPQISFNAQKGLKNLWVGSTVKYRSFVAGLGVGTLSSTSLKGTLGIQNHAVRLMYGFDYSNSALESGMFASHEVSLRVLLGVKRKNWSRFKI